MHIQIQWDPDKARANLKKHGVRFSEVEPVFFDEFALSMPDESVPSEQRFVVVGCDAIGRTVTVCYTYRGAHIRLISARRATKRERLLYEEGIRL